MKAHRKAGEWEREGGSNRSGCLAIFAETFRSVNTNGVALVHMSQLPKSPCTIYHMVLPCPNHPAPQDGTRLQNHCWETAIRASDAEGQRLPISLAEEACKTNGTPDVGPGQG